MSIDIERHRDSITWNVSCRWKRKPPRHVYGNRKENVVLIDAYLDHAYLCVRVWQYVKIDMNFSNRWIDLYLFSLNKWRDESSGKTLPLNKSILINNHQLYDDTIVVLVVFTDSNLVQIYNHTHTHTEKD